MKLFEMEGFLRGKCIPRDLKVNETNAEYLVRKFAEADAMCAALAAELKQSQIDAGCYKHGMEASNARLVQVAAEVEAVKSAHQDAVGTIMYTANRTGVLYTEKTIQMSCKTPSTDAFLAEVQAQGVEMFAAVLRRKGDDAFFDAIAEAQANAADQFAAQLRKGVQS